MPQPHFYRSCDIIEFLDGDDAEGRLLGALFDQHAVQYYIEFASQHDSVEDLFSAFTNAVVKRNRTARLLGEPMYSPEIHLSCHGCEKGIGWKDGSLITWSRLAALLWRFSCAIGYTTAPNRNGAWTEETSCVSLSLSCCNGSSAASEFFSKEPFPVGGFIAPVDTIFVNDCAQFFLHLYTSFAIDGPYNAPQKVELVNKAIKPQGPSGLVPIRCYAAPLTPNEHFKA